MAKHESNPMKGGDDIYSYARNSQYQKAVVDAAKGLLNEAISDKLDFEQLCCLNSSNNVFQIADMGCSVGPNTFFAVQNIIEAVERHYYHYSSKHQNLPTTLEFQVYFNDHVDNDFNTLFRTIPLSKKYLAAGAPGSFHGRLFPNSTLHFVHSSYALQWLSKVPKEVMDKHSPAWNKGRIHSTGTVKEVVEAYYDQYMKDMESFLSARAQEVVNGGLMVLIVSGLPDGVPHSESCTGMLYDLLCSCLNDMAKMGKITEEEVDSVNLPVYYPSIAELKEVIDKNGYFSLEKMDMDGLDHPMGPSPATISAKMVAMNSRAVMEETFKKHFGEGIIEELFSTYFSPKISENQFIFGEEYKKKNIDLFILLKRKSN